jgi:hypothetical protein
MRSIGKTGNTMGFAEMLNGVNIAPFRGATCRPASHPCRPPFDRR